MIEDTGKKLYNSQYCHLMSLKWAKAKDFKHDNFNDKHLTFFSERGMAFNYTMKSHEILSESREMVFKTINKLH